MASETISRQWVITAYGLAFGGLLLLGGRVGDRFGRRRVLLVSVVAFTLASALGGAASSFAVLVLARALQGVAAALLAPAALGTLNDTFSDASERGKAERGKAFGVFAAVYMGGAAIGLLLGGILTQYLSWRWCMYVNVIFGAVAFFGALAYLADENSTVRASFDLVGTVLVSVGLFALVFGFSRVETDGWTSGGTFGSLALGTALLVSFVHVERKVTHPLLPLRLVTDRSHATAFAMVGITTLSMFAMSLFLSYYLQLVKGFSPVTCGLAFLPMIFGSAASSNISNIVTLPRFGPRVVITFGMTLAFVGLGLLSRVNVHTSYVAGVLPTLILVGIGMGSIMAPSLNVATAGVQPQDSGVASALVSTMQQVGGSIGVAVMSVIAASATNSYASSHPPVRGFNPTAATHGYAVVFLVAALVFAAGSLLALILFPSKTRLNALRESVAGPSPASRGS